MIDEIARYAPNLPAAIEHVEVLTPHDLEDRFGLIGGNIMQGELTPDQMFSFRPIPFYGDHRTPVEELYLCGAGTHPGGGVMGVNGRNASTVMLKDVRGAGRELWSASAPAAGGVREPRRAGRLRPGRADVLARAGRGVARAHRALRRAGQRRGAGVPRRGARRRQRDRRARGRGRGPGSARGLPLLVKDNEDSIGLPTTFGSRRCGGVPVERDCEVVGRLVRRRVVVGKTNLPEFAFEGYTSNERFGTRNPWAMDWSPGGSSGARAPR